MLVLTCCCHEPRDERDAAHDVKLDTEDVEDVAPILLTSLGVLGQAVALLRQCFLDRLIELVRG